MKKVLSILIFLIFCSCNKSEFKTIDFGSFEITVPSNWNEYEIKGIDSYVGGIITDTNDTLIFDLGWYSPDVSENDFPMVFDSYGLSELSQKEREILPTTNHLIVDTLSGDIEFEKYLRYKSELDSLDCFEVKFITPRNKGFGATGIYIDSLKGSDENHDKVRFGFYGNHLSDSTQIKFLNAIRTLRFEKYCLQHNL
ncbi:hypothetical protein MTsPCn5_19850 [Croceitalea sp. MTPC5]|uniref:hypothetical protein n=1 Tax=Croceitalea sp. MTPC5 TaxID=3056565 RepID=UPI002B3BE89E|nr:hypothetical protein MTsPCn5_19850 [Croceitalea sp. MTPC5]